MNEDGSVSVFGRADDLIVTGGENVSPAAIERFLETLSDVDRAVVVGIPDEEWGEVVAAALQPRPGIEPSSESLEPGSILEISLRQGLKASQRPRKLLWLDKFPETASGKVDRAAIRQLLLSALTGRRSRP